MSQKVLEDENIFTSGGERTEEFQIDEFIVGESANTTEEHLTTADG